MFWKLSGVRISGFRVPYNVLNNPELFSVKVGRGETARGFQAMRMGGFHANEAMYSRPGVQTFGLGVSCFGIDG